MVSTVDIAKRALVKLLLQYAAFYRVALSLTRDSPADAVKEACRKVAVKVHPDKGGSVEQQTALNTARDDWEAATAKAPGRGKKRKATDAAQPASSSEQVVTVLPVRQE